MAGEQKCTVVTVERTVLIYTHFWWSLPPPAFKLTNYCHTLYLNG